jgi:hypothetical protein
MANLAFEARIDTFSLASSHPALVPRFREIRDQLDSSMNKELELPPMALSQSPELSFSETDYTVAKAFDGLVKRIEQVLLGPSKSGLHQIASMGHIVVFNVSDIRSDAFIVTPDKVRCIQLPLTLKSLKNMASRFMDAILSTSDPISIDARAAK